MSFKKSNKFIDEILSASAVVLVSQTVCFIVLVICILINAVPHIDVTSQSPNVDYGILSERQMKTLDDIIDSIYSGDNIVYCPSFTSREQHEITTHLSLYLGAIDDIPRMLSWGSNCVIINRDVINDLIFQKIIIDARIDEAISTIADGSDEFKLRQIVKYISSKMEYTDGFRNTVDALNGRGVCDSYAMLFYKMSTRAGLKCYICYGYANDAYHAWNVVELDGADVYFDITWYDGYLYDIRYVFSESSWDRQYQINNIWSTDIEE